MTNHVPMMEGPAGPQGLPQAASLIGRAESLRPLLCLIQRAGLSEVPVLVEGESGTGKELVARAIHGVRRAGPFLPVECGRFPANRVERKLLQAREPRAGSGDFCSPGTLFFDEIADLPMLAQSSLLQALQRQDGPRIIAATSRNLIAEAEQDRFRFDLYLALNTIAIELPPLRDRIGDLPALIRHFLGQTGRHYRFGPGLLEGILEHSWPGNVRELKSCIARLIALSPDDTLHAEHLPFPVAASGTGPRRS